jgi:uncharacterized protein (TIGR02118 family)
MTKVFFCLRRRPELSHQEFIDYWSKTHGPLAVKAAKYSGLKRYIQNWSVPSTMADAGRALRGTPAAFDGIAEAWIDEEERLRMMNSDSGKVLFEQIFADEKKFIDMDNSVFFAVEEHVLIGSVCADP